MIKNRVELLAACYIAASILIGPGIAIAGYLITPANGDFCDSSPHGSLEQRDRDYALIDTIQMTGAITMLAIAALLAAGLIWQIRRIGWLHTTLLGAGMLVISCGYYLILSMATYGNPTC